MKTFRLYALGALLSLCASDVLCAARTQVALLPSHEVTPPGGTVTVGVRLRMPFGWHSYWKYAGDSGDATKITWTLPSNWVAGEIEWPLPEKHLQAGFTTYVYHNDVVLLVPLKVPADAPAGRVELKARVAWQECEKVCILGKTDVQASLAVGPQARLSTDAASLESWRARCPLPATNLNVTAKWEKPATDNPRPLLIAWTAAQAAKEVDFFPLAGREFALKGETEVLSAAPPMFRVRKQVEKTGGEWPAELPGVLVEKGAQTRAFQVTLALGGGQRGENSTAPSTSPASESAAAAHAATTDTAPVPTAVTERSLPVILLLAFVAGLILNVMPCVLPVIALKVLAFVNQGREAPARRRLLGSMYGLGVLGSFLALALLAVGVQQAGGQASWGMLLQNQVFRVVLTVLITLVALNLFGVFEVTAGGRVMGAAGELASREGLSGAFLNGILATVLATPCTAPFLSTALAFAFTQPPLVTLLVFFCVGLGLAAPFVLLCWQPAWLRLLPKPGAWMERFKVAMGFPMLATAVWLFWFTAPRFGKSGVLWLGLFLVVLAAAAWVWGEFVQRGARRRGLAMGLALALVIGAYAWILENQLAWRTRRAGATESALRESPDGIDWRRWSADAVATARAQGHPVLVDFTADNCLNCQINKRTSLEISTTRAKLKEIDAVALLGDFSDEDPLIAAELRRYGRPGVPLVLVYPRDTNKPAIVLPEILTPQRVLDALDAAVN